MNPISAAAVLGGGAKREALCEELLLILGEEDEGEGEGLEEGCECTCVGVCCMIWSLNWTRENNDSLPMSLL